MAELSVGNIEQLLTAVGALLRGGGQSYSIVVVGGACLNLLGFVSRTTSDIDIAAIVEKRDPGTTFVHPDPLPKALQDAIATVARDFQLPSDWMNAKIASQWPSGLPQFIFRDIDWRWYGALEVGLVGRLTLIALKLHAAVDRDYESVHYQDLVTLAPTDSELVEARATVLAQDSGAEFPELVDTVIAHVKRDIATG